jgi:thiol peroxidase
MTPIRAGALLWKGKPVDVAGPELKPGDPAPAGFALAATDLSPVTAADLAGRPRILLAVPSLDTPICEAEVRRFNGEAAQLPDVRVYVVSMDLPFAQKRWRGVSGVDRVRTLSDYRDRSFGAAHGVLVPAFQLLARAVFAIDGRDVIRHVEYVKDVTWEPDYDAALAAARAMVNG